MCNVQSNKQISNKTCVELSSDYVVKIHTISYVGSGAPTEAGSDAPPEKLLSFSFF